MSIIMLPLVVLCVAMVLGRPRYRPSEVPLALNGRIRFDCLPGVIPLQLHDIHVRAELAVPIERASRVPTARRRGLPEAV